jgi:endoglucanase
MLRWKESSKWDGARGILSQVFSAQGQGATLRWKSAQPSVVLAASKCVQEEIAPCWRRARGPVTDLLATLNCLEGHLRELLLSVLVAAFVFSAGCARFSQQSNNLHTSGNQILDSDNKAVRLAGVNWYGFETADKVVHGLWAKDYHEILQSIKDNGYNTIRLPFSNEMIEHPIVPRAMDTNSFNNDLAGLNSLEIMDKIVAGAGALGLRVILDNHRSTAGDGPEPNGLWYTNEYPESAWINDWTMLAKRYGGMKGAEGKPVLIGMDLRNEPHLNPNGSPGTGACWTGDPAKGGCSEEDEWHNWPKAAERAGNAILRANSNLLIFVEGLDCYDNDCGWWGGNLKGVAGHPVELAVENRLVYSPHDFGPDLYPQKWFHGATTRASLYETWDKYFGFIYNAGTAPLWVGEFGTGNNGEDASSDVPGSQGQWFNSLVQYMGDHSSMGWSYYALNGQDAYSLLDNRYDATPASSMKQQLLERIQFRGR